MNRTFVMVALLGLAACRSGRAVYTFQATAPQQPAKPPDCAFDVVAQVPDGEQYEELGVLDADRVPSNKLGTFKMHAAPTVCRAGGDLVVGQINGAGLYVRGVVFRRRAPRATPAGVVAGGTKL